MFLNTHEYHVKLFFYLNSGKTKVYRKKEMYFVHGHEYISYTVKFAQETKIFFDLGIWRMRENNVFLFKSKLKFYIKHVKNCT